MRLEEVTVNGRSYRRPQVPVVCVCIDGSEPAYTEAAMAAGAMPWLADAIRSGTWTTAEAAMPSFTNPNNLSIVTGAPPAVHGISGNYFFDRASGAEVMMNDPRFLRAPTILAGFFDAGARVAVVTAKDKLRLLLGNGLRFDDRRAVCFSAERADHATEAENGIGEALQFVGQPLPEVYSADLSTFVLAAGVRLLGAFRPDLMYLSTTDYIQHKHAPGAPEANAFYAAIDRHLAQLDAAGAIVAWTADHGMNDKHNPDGSPDVIYLSDLFDRWYGPGRVRVILPITDPYVVHHGALGSFATAYLPHDAEPAETAARLARIDGVALALTAAEACRRLDLPEDRIGDVVIVSDRPVVLGTSAARHDLSGLDAPLRSHGGLSETRVPLFVNRPVGALPERLRNYDLFDLALNRA